MQSPFPMMAAYNAWANRRLYDAAAALPDADYRADRGAFFKSVHGTLNHLLVADRIWMRRFTGEGEHPNRLDAILFEDFAELRRAREADVGSILGFGFAPYTGGALSYIDFMGASAFLALCERLQAKHGERFTAPKIIRDMAASGGTFYGRAEARKAA